MGADIGKVLGGDQVKKVSGIMKAMTKSMTQSLSVPTFSVSDDIEVTRLLQLK